MGFLNAIEICCTELYKLLVRDYNSKAVAIITMAMYL